MPDSPEHKSLAAKIAAEFARRLVDFIPEAQYQITRSSKSKFSCAVVFEVTKSGPMVATCHFKQSPLPVPSIEFKITLVDGQLSLFDGANEEPFGG